MAETVTKISSIQFKRGTYTALYNWTAIPQIGEPIYDTTNKKIKIGDGINTWKNLPYVGEGSSPSPTGQTKLVYDTIYDLPAVGNKETVYVVANGNTYIWNDTAKHYNTLYVNNKQFYGLLVDEEGNVIGAERQIDGGGASANYEIDNFIVTK